MNSKNLVASVVNSINNNMAHENGASSALRMKSSPFMRSSSVKNEWIEIVPPHSKDKIYANLSTGLCAKYPPEGASIRRSEDFSEHWWELYDDKTGRLYYYNEVEGKTAWTKPQDHSSDPSKRVLIIPVNRLQRIQKNDASWQEARTERRDACTQTSSSNLVSVSTQTCMPDDAKEEEAISTEMSSLYVSDVCKATGKEYPSEVATDQNQIQHHRQLSDLSSQDRVNHFKDLSKRTIYERQKSTPESSTSSLDHPNPLLSRLHQTSQNAACSFDVQDNYVGRSAQEARSYEPHDIPPVSKSTNTNQNNNISPRQHSNNSHDRQSHVSTFVSSINRAHDQKPPMGITSNRNAAVTASEPASHRITTNNLSHYLVREARAMGIALISDDELDDDEPQESEDDNVNDEEEETDIRDDNSSHCVDELNASQDLCEDGSSDGWKSFSDQESPNHQSAHHGRQRPPHAPPTNDTQSPLDATQTSSMFTFNNLIDDEKDPASCRSQQLDHRKLVDNFKKSRQTASFGLYDSLGRSCKFDPNNAVQNIKSRADNYFHRDKSAEAATRQIKQLAALSTLPRPDRSAHSRAPVAQPPDEDYDVVEENCGYYSDSDRLAGQSMSGNSAAMNTQSAVHAPVRQTSSAYEPPSPSHHSPFDRNKSTRGSTFSVESFARENLSRHPKKGGLLFNRKVKWSRMITWTKSSIKQPMISSVNADLNADSIASFKLIQQYMGDRKIVMNKRYRRLAQQLGIKDVAATGNRSVLSTSSVGPSANTSTSSSGGGGAPNGSAVMIPDRLRDELAFELVCKGCAKATLRDEIYVQLARQLTENPNHESVVWGLVLLSILLSYFSPSTKFSPFLLSFLETHPHQIAHDVCLPRLEKRLRQTWLTYCRKPADGKEISIVRLSITKWPQYCGVFGESLERIMSLQNCSTYLKTLRLPWILTTLGEKLIDTGGAETEGIFRCAADHDLIAQLRLEIDCVDFRKITDAEQVRSLLSNVHDPHVIAGLLKLFFRQLSETVFPAHIYDVCLRNGHDGQLACRVFDEHLASLNKDVSAYLIGLLQMLARPEQVAHTKMDNSNLSMVWAPNLLRAPTAPQPDSTAGSTSGSKWSISNGGSEDAAVAAGSTSNVPSATNVPTSQSMIFEQTRLEMQFIRALIINLDTSFIGEQRVHA